MADFSFNALGENQFELSGELNFMTVPVVLEKAGDFIQGSSAITVDMAKVSSVNSAAMALLIEWKSIARQNNVEIKFLNIPVQITRLAEVCGVESLLVA